MGTYLLHDGLLLVEALLGSRGQDTARGAAQLPRHLLTLCLRSVLLDKLPAGIAHLLGPLGTFLLSGISLGHILALLFLNGFTVNDVIFHLVLVVPGLTLALVDGLTLLGTLTLAHQWGMAEPDRLIKGHFLVLNEAALLEVLIALFLLLWLEVGGVGSVATLRIGVVALNLFIVLRLLDHDHLVNTTLASSSNVANAQFWFVTGSLSVPLPGIPRRKSQMFAVIVGVVMVIVVTLVLGGEGEDPTEIASLAGHLGVRGAHDQDQQTNLAQEKVYVRTTHALGRLREQKP